MFEADKDVVYLDYGAVTIVEKTGRSGYGSNAGHSGSAGRGTDDKSDNYMN